MSARGDLARLCVEVEPFHLDRPFDYAIPEGLRDVVVPGGRVQVGFAGRSRRALVLDVVDETAVEPGRLRDVSKALGGHVWVTPDELDVLRWAAQRFQGPLSDVVRHALPSRVVDVERRAVAAGWLVGDPGDWHRPTLGPGPTPTGLPVPEAWGPYQASGASLWESIDGGHGSHYWRPHPREDVGQRLLELASLCVAGGRGVLVLVPDPKSRTADTLVAGLEERDIEVVDVRGGPSNRIAYDRWLRARCGRARVVVGERGAVFHPVANLGLAVVVDEANPAFKERRSPRHHVREVALERARRVNGVGLLVGMVPSAPAWSLLAERRVTAVIADRREERHAAPLVSVADERGGFRTLISSDAVRGIRTAIANDQYAVVLAARRGEGRVLVCRGCHARVACPTCQGSTEPFEQRLACSMCGWEGIRRCRSCGKNDLVPLAAGTGRLATEIARNVDVPVAVLEGYATGEVPPAPAVLVVTRGAILDHPPGPVGVAVLADLDALLRRPALDAAEDALRLSMQLALWVATTGPKDGEQSSRSRASSVIVQTREPEHPVVKALQAWDPRGFWVTEHAARQVLRFPPAASAIHIDAPVEADLKAVLGASLPPSDDLLGPLPGRERQRWLVKCDDRSATLRAIAAVRTELSQRNLDLRVDVDPVQVG